MSAPIVNSGAERTEAAQRPQFPVMDWAWLRATGSTLVNLGDGQIGEPCAACTIPVVMDEDEGQRVPVGGVYVDGIGSDVLCTSCDKKRCQHPQCGEYPGTACAHRQRTGEPW